MLGGYWQRVIDSDMAVPSERPLNELTAELVAMLGSSNAVDREQTSYSVLASWVSSGVYDDLLITLGDSIAAGLQMGLGEPEGDAVFRRSYSALLLGDCIARDNQASVLPVDVVLTWADRALSWFVREGDHRGWVEGKGWAHALAHGADLIGVLAQSRHLLAEHLGILLDVIAERLQSPTPRIWIDGEEDRLAAAVLTILQRNQVQQDYLDAWVETLGVALTRPHHREMGIEPSPEARNTSAFVRALYAHLAIGVHPINTTLSFTEPPACRADLLLDLLQIIPQI
ncbi:MAG: DUF2785 domain-containing protein, partial [Nocardioidaceae bacterium]|nr:DUF2785 domain-containing protein [Nocardioidaceae bacterium]